MPTLALVALTPSVMPETLRALVGDGSKPPPLFNCTPAALIRRRREEKQRAHRHASDTPDVLEDRPRPYLKFRPLASFLLLAQPDLLLILLWSSLYYALYYAVLYAAYPYQH